MRFQYKAALIAGIGLCVPAWAGQQNTPAAVPTTASAPVATPSSNTDARETLKERANAYYTALISGDRNAAEQFLTPESRNDFVIGRFRTLASVTVDQVNVDASAGKADVTVTRTFSAPAAMTIPWHDQWVNENGQWLLAFPPKSTDTPFGNFGPGKPAPAPADTQAHADAVKNMAERNARTADPDQYIKAIDKYLEKHPDALPQTAIQVPVPERPDLPANPQAGTKPAANGNAVSGTTPKNEKQTKKGKKKTKTPDAADKTGVAAPPKS